MAHEQYCLDRLKKLWERIESETAGQEDSLEDLRIKTYLLEEIADLQTGLTRQRHALTQRQEAARKRLAGEREAPADNRPTKPPG